MKFVLTNSWAWLVVLIHVSARSRGDTTTSHEPINTFTIVLHRRPGQTVLIDYEICSHEQLGLACGTNKY